MKTHKNTIKALAALVVGSLLVACGSGTSRSSSDSANSTGNSGAVQPQTKELYPVEISSDNYTVVASQSLKSLLLNDAGSLALNRSVNVSGDLAQTVAGVATGVVIELFPHSCLGGGQVAFKATIADANNDAQINFNQPVTATFHTSFAECVQAGNLLDGQVVLDISGNLSQWFTGAGYSLSARASTTSLTVNQQGMPSFNLAGEFSYDVHSADGINVTTEIVSVNSAVTADTLYQMVDFHLIKDVNNASKTYSYHVNSEFTDPYNPTKVIQYTTEQPLTGTGFALPSGGVLRIVGVDSTVFVHVEENEVLRLVLDLDDDGVAEEEYLTNWHDLVMNAFNNVQF